MQFILNRFNPLIFGNMIRYHAINGLLLPDSEASILVSDLSVLRGYGVFDFFAVKSGMPVFLEDYLDRFYRSADKLHLELPMHRAQLQSVIREVIAANNAGQCGIRLEATGGYSPDGFTPAEPNMLVLYSPLPMPSGAQYQNGIRLMLYPFQRELPEVKSINYLTGIYILPALRAKNADAVLYHDNGLVRESDRSNFFIVSKEGKLLTPADKVLEGITRKKVLQLAGALLEAEQRDLQISEILQAEEAFITSTTKGVLPVVAIDGHRIGPGVPGRVAKELGRMFEELTLQYIQQTIQV